MDKDLIMRLLQSNSVDMTDLGTFISEYTYQKKNKHISAEELQGIIQCIQLGIFDLRYAVIEAAKSLGLNVMNILNNDGSLIKTHLYSDFK